MIKSGILKPVQYATGKPKARQRWQRVIHIECFRLVAAIDPSLNPRYMWLFIDTNCEYFILDLDSNAKKRPAVYRAAYLKKANEEWFMRRTTVRSDTERQRILKLWHESL